MIMAFFIFLAILIADYEKSKIEFCDKMIYVGDEILLLMHSTIPDTNGIFAILKNSERLKDIDIFNIDASSPLKSKETDKIKDYINSVGKCDVDSLIKKSKQFSDDFRLIKNDYQQYYKSHYKLIYAFCISLGLVISILLV